MCFFFPPERDKSCFLNQITYKRKRWRCRAPRTDSEEELFSQRQRSNLKCSLRLPRSASHEECLNLFPFHFVKILPRLGSGHVNSTKWQHFTASNVCFFLYRWKLWPNLAPPHSCPWNRCRVLLASRISDRILMWNELHLYATTVTISLNQVYFDLSWHNRSHVRILRTGWGKICSQRNPDNISTVISTIMKYHVHIVSLA